MSQKNRGVKINSKYISIIIPCLNEHININLMYEHIVNIQQENMIFELIFINDGSTDDSKNRISMLCKKESWVKAIHFSRNFGQQKAVKAGIDHCSGDYVVVLDGDLQHPPELIKEMVRKVDDGFDIVHARRYKRKGETFFKRWTSLLFYRCFNLLSDVTILNETGDFRCFNKKVCKEMKKINEKDLFYRGLFPWVGFKQTEIQFEIPERKHGKTKFGVWKMAQLAMNGILSFSSIPLKIASIMGFLIFVGSFSLIIYNGRFFNSI